jgi:hypothetical protein
LIDICSSAHLDSNMSKSDITAYNRDGFGRLNPDALLGGTFSGWAVIIILLSSNQLILFLFSISIEFKSYFF